MSLTIDHVTIAASRLEAAATAFSNAGLAADYGGSHSNAVTHMYLLGFDDGSYIELVSSMRPGLQSPWWHTHIANDGGPCAWAVRSSSVAREARRLRSLGVTVDGPHSMERSRPDGEQVAWDLAFVGDHGAGAMHPFVIEDRTPRELRAPVSQSVAHSELTGVRAVALAVSDLDGAIESFMRVYDLPKPERVSSGALEANVAMFPGSPVALCTPREGGGWLADRLALLGDSPCGFLLSSSDVDATRARFDLTAPEDWDGTEVSWFDGDSMWPLRLGVIRA